MRGGREATGGEIMLVVYIAGPFRASSAWDIECNIRRAETLALEVWRAGAAAICPHTNTRYFQGAAPDEVWLEGDLAIMKKCDAVLLTEDWDSSAGARRERQEAVLWGLPVFISRNQFELPMELKKYIEEKQEEESRARKKISRNVKQYFIGLGIDPPKSRRGIIGKRKGTE